MASTLPDPGTMRQVALDAARQIHQVVGKENRRAGIVALPEPHTNAAQASGVLGADLTFPPIGAFPPPLTMSFGGGPTAAGSGVELIFWGSAWNDPATTPSAARLTADVQSMLSGPWRAGLRQYGIGAIPFMGAMTVTQPAPPANFDDGDIDSLFLRLVGGGAIPAGLVTLFIVLMPPGTNYIYAPGALRIRGKHWALVYQAEPLGPDTAWLGLVLNNTEEQMMSTLSHELCEMLTDPDAAGGWVINALPQNGEIGDPCNNINWPLNGVTLQAYWSLKDNACLMPTAPSVRTTLAMGGIVLAGKGMRSIRNPIPSMNSLIDVLYGATL